MSDDERADDDWFESALNEGDKESAAEEADEEGAEASDPFGTGSDAEAPFGAGESQPFGGEREGEPSRENEGELFGEESGSGDDLFAAEESSDEGGPLFDDDFGSAMSSAGPGAEASSDDFEDEDFESEMPRIDMGISGLDDMIQGGVPERHLMVTIGSPGTGKTTFGLQFLYHGLQQGDNAVFITLEQSREAILDTANERGWEFDRYEAEDDLAIVDLDPVEMANSLDNIRGELPQLIREFDAERLVLDSVSLLEMMYDDQAKRRTEVFDFTRSLKAAGVTTMLTSEASEDNPYASRYGIIEYLTDAVFILQYIRGDAQETRLAVEIQKVRNANHSRATKPYDITLDGIDVYQQASIF
ncbi:MAG: KaiC domain-containing protein [Halapricum sp.]